MTTKSLVDDALAKVNELGTVGAMKWLAEALESALSAQPAQPMQQWVIAQRPNQTPHRKGPFQNKKQLEEMLRGLYGQYPDYVCTVIDMPHTSWPQSGREWLDMYGDQRRKRVPAAPVSPISTPLDSGAAPSKHSAQHIDKKGCCASLAPGQYWRFCGETDMGQSMPVLCTHCGGEFIRAAVQG